MEDGQKKSVNIESGQQNSKLIEQLATTAILHFLIRPIRESVASRRLSTGPASWGHKPEA